MRASVPRREVVIATKVGLPVDNLPGGLRPERMAAAIDVSLRRLGVEHVDLWQLHGWDPDVPIEETMGAMADAVCGRLPNQTQRFGSATTQASTKSGHTHR